MASHPRFHLVTVFVIVFLVTLIISASPSVSASGSAQPSSKAALSAPAIPLVTPSEAPADSTAIPTPQVPSGITYPLRVMVPHPSLGPINMLQEFPQMDPARGSKSLMPGPRMNFSPRNPLNPSAQAMGSFKLLAVLVQFSDKASQVTATSFDSLIFGSTDSVSSYYKDVSYLQLDLVTLSLPSVFGWRTAPQTYSYYVDGKKCTDGVYPHNCQKLAEDIATALDSSVNFADYDNNNDGQVDTLIIVHAGPGAERTLNNNDVWSHSWETVNHPHLDGKDIVSYTIEPEYWNNPGDMTRGVYAHELGHAFGLPDLYDVSKSSEGVGNWSLMGGGSWNGPNYLGAQPAQLDAWSRVYLGFAAATNVSGSTQAISLPNVEQNQSGAIYRLDTGHPGEYFLLENRHALLSDAYLPSSGLLIWHVDDSVTGSNLHRCLDVYNWNCLEHFRVALEQADGLLDMENGNNRGDAGDPYPGTSSNTAFAFSTNPNTSSYYFNVDPCTAINSVSGSASTMTANIVGSSIVDSLADDGPGSLRCAIRQAPNGGTITFDPAVFSMPRTILLTSGALPIDRNLTVQGPGATLLTIDGNHASTVFSISTPGAVVDISGVTITNGNAVSSGLGGGIYNAGTLAVSNVALTNNAADLGGGIGSIGALTVSNSSLSGNSASVGGGIYNWNGTLTVSNSTLANNSSSSSGGGIRNNGGTLTVSNSTVASNSASSSGGGIDNNNILNLGSTIVANNTGSTGPDIGGPFTSQGNNLIGNTSGATGTWLGSDQQNVNPLLSALANNGGQTQTMAPQASPPSPAIGAGNCSLALPVTTDQRGPGYPRKTPCDVGAYESVRPVSCTGVTEIPLSECQALVDLYNNTSGATWTHSDNWHTPTPCSSPWYGVTCTSGHVTSLDLDTNNLSGTLPSSLSNLSALQWLNLSFSPQLTGSIPTLPNSLTVVFLNYNQLSGTIPALPSSLQTLNLGDNQLSGPIPALPSGLQALVLQNNQLSGPIPALPATLSWLQMPNNQLSGSIPTLPTALTHLELQNNQLNGAIPALPSALFELILYNNQLGGPIPALPDSLQFVYLHTNQLSGTIPALPSGLRSLFLGHNQLSGVIPTLPNSAVQPLANLDLSYNQLSGTIPTLPDSLGNLNLSNNQLSGVIPTLPTSLGRLDLSVNQLSGAIPVSLVNTTIPLPPPEYLALCGGGNSLTPASSAVNSFIAARIAGWNGACTPAAADTIGGYNPATSVYYLRTANASGPANFQFQFGPAGAGWKPLAGDWNGDGTVTIGGYNPANGVFYLRNNNASGNADYQFQFGPAGAGWLPIAGDWNGDGIDTIGGYNPANGVFYLRNSNNGGPADYQFQFGPAGAGWLPIAGDWNGNGTDTIGGYNPTNSVFYLRNTNNGGPANYQFQFGPAGAGWKPLAGDWNGDGTDTIGGYNPANGVFYLRNANAGGNADYQFQFGPANVGWLPIAGDWNGPLTAVQANPVATAAPTQSAQPIAPTFVPSRK